MSESSASYWRDIRQRAFKPASTLEWAEQIAVWGVALILLYVAFGMDRAKDELTTSVATAVAGVLVGGVFLVWRLARAAVASHEDGLKAVQRIEAERDLARQEREALQKQLDGRRRNQQLADELEELRANGLHKIRNDFEEHPENLLDYIGLEKAWLAEIQAAMERGGCTIAEIGSVMNVSNTEIGRAAAGAKWGPDGNWLIGLMEMRLDRLRAVIQKYAN